MATLGETDMMCLLKDNTTSKN